MEDLSLHILDVAENCIAAGASLVEITVEEDVAEDRLVITVRDNGRGMDPDFVSRVLDPFTTTRTTRKVGLGLSLFQQSAQEAGGDVVVASSLGMGTTVTAFMRHSHIDRKPMGDMAETMVTLIEGNPAIDFVYTHRRSNREYVLDTRELRAYLEELPLNSPGILQLIRDNVKEGIDEVARDLAV